MTNYYEILEVSEKASKEVIEKAYKALAKKYHPDLNRDNRKEAEAKMKELNEAFEVLVDDNKRANYDNILNKKRELQRKKEAYSNTSSNNTSAKSANASSSSNNIDKKFEDYNTVSYSNGYYTDQEDNFFVNTTNMDEKTKKKLQAKMQERYLEAYDAYLRERGYKLKYRWTFKKVLQVIAVIVVTILVFTILFFIPPIHEFCLELYEENIIVKLIVDIVISLFNAIFSAFQ